ncbi:hypothetical protein ISR92_01825 [Patescibacteria group bacterium]|nr:hypothetical protein [Patescibacteria group bacterium]
MAEINNLSFWKYFTNFWSWLTLLVFVFAFFYPNQFNGTLSAIAVIYASILGIYVGSKEIARWRNKGYISKHYGEIYVIIWTIVIVAMIITAIFNHQYQLQSEFTATYITILGIFAISQKSKALKHLT